MTDGRATAGALRRVDLTGKRFGAWTVVSIAEKTVAKQPKQLWLCLCDCGVTRKVAAQSLRNGASRSCGCLSRDFISEKMRAASRKTKEYHDMSVEARAWRSMVSRCRIDPAYTERGIAVCERWLGSFGNFLEDMGGCPGPAYTIERKNNDLGYMPSNCVWADKVTQARNRRRPSNWHPCFTQQE